MKKITVIFFLCFLAGACKTMPISMNPGKGSFNSGTIGSVRATNNIPVSNTGATNFNFMDTSYRKVYTVHN
jgi:hypothetical protein